MIRSPTTGLVIPEVDVGGEVVEGECIAHLLDVEHVRSIRIHSPAHGFLYRLSHIVGDSDTKDQDMTPVLYEGDPLAMVYPLRASSGPQPVLTPREW